jgi:hypothetical protein
MAVFLAASDETSGGNIFAPYHYAGWLAPEPDWTRFFTPAWRERVLDGPPKIPYLHMTDIRSRAWREQWHVTQTDADERLDEAARVIDTMGSLYPLKLTIDASISRPLYKPHKMIAASGAKKDYQPDFLAFTSYALAVLIQVKLKHPDVEKVDFLVENNSEITKHIYELYKAMPVGLDHIKRPELIPLLGKFIPGGKDRVPLQAADYLCWHSQRADAGTLSDVRDARRWNTISHRKGFNLPLDASLLTDLAQAFAERGKENEPNKTIRELRPHHARVNKRSARRDKAALDAEKAEGKAEG